MLHGKGGGRGGKGGGEKRGGGRTGNRRRTTMRSRKWRWITMRPEKEGGGRVKRMKDEFCPSKSQMLQGTLSIPMLNTSVL